ncbi:hypothetical protein L0337_04845 [candidate division KSB1 bacterium]|nr:hypothetical protein [candidate division KSB1 bacterium]
MLSARHDEGPNLGQRRIFISTSGLVPKIGRFTKAGHKFRLAISLNTTTDEVRNRIMPINRKYPICSQRSTHSLMKL